VQCVGGVTPAVTFTPAVIQVTFSEMPSEPLRKISAGVLPQVAQNTFVTASTAEAVDVAGKAINAASIIADLSVPQPQTGKDKP